MEFGQGVDYTQYATWPKVVAPSGQVYYKVPGTGYLFDPFLSSAKGRPVLFSDPSAQAAEVQKAKDQQAGLIKQEEFNRSPTGQLLPVAAGLAGTIGASYLVNQAATSPLEEAAAQIALQKAGVSGAGQAAAAAQGATALNAPAALSAPTGLSVGQAAPVAAEAPGLLSGFGGLGVLPTAAIAAGTYLGGKSAYDMLKGKEDKSTMGLAGRGILGMATGGISEIARPFMMHKSTREETADKTNELLKQSDDPNYQAYVSGMREQYKEAPKGAAYAGKYNTFDEYKQAGLEANDLTGVYGNIKAFGPEWANMTQEQRVAVTKGIIDAGLYDSKKGDVIIKDENKAKEIKNQVLTGFEIGTQLPQAQAAAQGAMAVPRPVSKNFKR